MNEEQCEQFFIGGYPFTILPSYWKMCLFNAKFCWYFFIREVNWKDGWGLAAAILLILPILILCGTFSDWRYWCRKYKEEFAEQL